MEKTELCRKLITDTLEPEGRFVIADIAWPDTGSMERYKLAIGGDWVGEEYWLADETELYFNQAGMDIQFKQVSPCAGVFRGVSEDFMKEWITGRNPVYL